MIWRILLFELIALVVVAGIWLGAPLVGVTSVFWRVMLIVLLLVPPLAVIVWKLVQRRRASAGLERELQEQGKKHQQSVRPDRQGEIKVLNEAFGAAVGSLRRSRLGGGGRGNALYALPWYMIIGPPAAGKSTALLRSGLKFPFTAGERKAIKGVGGTRNCDWWFSDQAILLDTAGRYTSQDEDLDEWLAFLRMVRRYRKRRPLNGLIVAVSIADVVNASADGLEEMATQIRSRIDQVISELQLALPIYVLFTKCDLVAGFVEFFGDLGKASRGQVLGFTLPLADGERKLETLFRREFDLVAGRLRRRAVARLARAKTQQRGLVYQFPLQFIATRDALASFVAQLMAANPYQEAPRLRGVYFCSGTQEGKPFDRVLGTLTRALGLREVGQTLAEKPAKKSYFLRDVFTRVIFPDQHLAGMTAGGLKRQRYARIGALAGAILATFLLLSLGLTTFLNNRALVAETVSLARRSRNTTPEDPRRVSDSLKALDALGAKVDQLRAYERDGAPWSMRLGMYQGRALFEPAERVYVQRMRQAFVAPAGTELEASLVDIATATDTSERALDAANDFKLLKTYLMVTEPERLEVDFAAPVLLAQWKKRLHPDVADELELLERNARRYLALLKRGRADWLDRVEEVIHNARQALRARDAEYRSLIGDAEQKFRPLSLRDALRGRVQSTILARHEVPGIYTRTGWSKHVRARLAKKAVSGASVEPWVLGEDEGGNIGQRLRKRYFEQYVAAWLRFLEGLSLQPAADARESLLLLQVVTEPPSLYEELFKSIVHHTTLPLVDLPEGPGGARSASRLLQRATRGRGGRLMREARYLGADKAIAEKLRAGGPSTPVGRYFLPIHDFVAPGAGYDQQPQVSGLDQYLEQLGKVREALEAELGGTDRAGPGGLAQAIEEATRVTKGVLAVLPGKLRRTLQDLFYQPLEITGTTARAAQAGRSSESFSNELCASFQEKLAGRYPFANASREALMQDVIEFFAPQGVVWSYYERNLRERLPRRGDRFEPVDERTVPEPIVAFVNRAWQITRALFPFGVDVPRLRFEVRARPVVLAAGSQQQVSEIVLEVEGKAQTYRNGPPEVWTLDWNGQGSRSRLLVRGAGGLREEIAFEGDWSLLRLIDRGRAKPRGSWVEVSWRLKGGEITVPMDIRPSRTRNPLFERLTLNCK